jgi:hypothetical protein
VSISYRFSGTRVSSARVSAFPRRSLWAARLGVVALLAVGCGGGAYGFARTYKPLGSEQHHFDRAQQPTYQDVLRDPNAYAKVEIGWFGVVTEVQSRPDGRTRLVLALRAHQPRHQCSDESASSCRVTVSATSLGTFSADVSIKGSDREGPERIWVGSLLKVYGLPTGEYDETTGPVLDVKYYRHWPRGYYVTTAQRADMRR